VERATGTVRVLIVDDNEVFRDALELLLGMRPEIEVVGTVASGGDAIAACRRHDPDVVLMDFRLPGLDGVQATAAIHQWFPRTQVVCLTASASEPERTALLGAGAAACLSKDQALDEIVAAVRAAAESGRPAP
jgi:DNA-binding NarL/FixJ family response regulator